MQPKNSIVFNSTQPIPHSPLHESRQHFSTQCTCACFEVRLLHACNQFLRFMKPVACCSFAAMLFQVSTYLPVYQYRHTTYLPTEPLYDTTVLKVFCIFLCIFQCPTRNTRTNRAKNGNAFCWHCQSFDRSGESSTVWSNSQAISSTPCSRHSTQKETVLSVSMSRGQKSAKVCRICDNGLRANHVTSLCPD